MIPVKETSVTSGVRIIIVCYKLVSNSTDNSQQNSMIDTVG